MEFNKAVEFVLKHEGGYVNDPDDPGGETKYGISKRSYPDFNIKSLTKSVAREIYFKDFWEKLDIDQLSHVFQLACFDTAVNCGPKKALELYEASYSLEDYLWRRSLHYTNLANRKPVMRKYMFGWMKRIADLYKYNAEE